MRIATRQSAASLGNLAALAVLAAGVGALVWIRLRSDIDPFTQSGMNELAERLGPWGPIVFALLVALAVVVSQLPGVPLTVAAGALWGPLPATVYAVAGGFMGGMIAYFLGRTLGRSVFRAITGKVIVFTRQRGEIYLGWVVFITRLLPVVSFDVVSYAAGVSGLSVRIYAIATLIGMTPSTLLLTLLGSHFSVRPLLALGLSAVALILVVALPVLVQRFGWFADVLRIEEPADARDPSS